MPAPKTMDDLAPPVSGPGGAGRLLLVGRSGSGKTVMLKSLIGTYGSGGSRDHRGAVVVVDVNDALTDLPMPRTERLTDIRPDRRRQPGVVWVPPPEGATYDEWNDLFRTIYMARGPVMLVLDETYAASSTFQRRGFLEALLTRGRARQKGLILGVQRPSQIPLHMIAQTDHVIAFDLPLAEDRRRIAQTIGQKSADGRDIEDRSALPRYRAWAWTPTTPEGAYEIHVDLGDMDGEDDES